MKAHDFIVGECEYCHQFVLTMEDRFRSADGRVIHCRCAEPAQIQDIMEKLEDIEK